MQGRVITFSSVDGTGLILAKVGKYGTKRPYPFSAASFLSSELPQVGEEVDFELNTRGQAISITRLLRNKVSLSLIDYA
ncbi:hypothetical protein [Moraxella sp. ZY210820]|uniref:hypothetical protein n=1 Tax=unclassified Moraxella TaxID=2685852 RepID=UPI0027303488|nr:hypothetical protein [Moraxella sp. ZY210820]WLF83712.1 hypothetical protein LU301_10720 [Moraxella sp. ZY210820]